MTDQDRPTTAVEVSANEYELGDALPVAGTERVVRGTNLLVLGPAMSGKRDLALSMLAHGTGTGEPAVVITTDWSPRQVVDRARPYHDGAWRPYVVDCSGRDVAESEAGTAATYDLSGPDDLTGIGISLVKATREIGDDARIGLRVGILSASTVLQYAGVDRTFNFLHTLRGRISAAGYLGVTTMDPTVHEPKTVNAFKALFDGMVEIREADDGTRQVRMLGLPGASREWTDWE